MSSSKVSSKKDCDVCCSTRSVYIKCLYCEKDACKSCQETYVLSQPSVKCMFCGVEWNNEFIETNFTKVFVGTKLREHNTNVLFEQEKQMLPQTQDELEVILHNEKINNDVNEITKEIKKLKETRLLLQRSKRSYRPKEKEKKEEAVILCPSSDCRGFLNSKWSCGICGLVMCKDCREIISRGKEEKKNEEEKEHEHKCDQNILENIKLIKKESKPCPKCQTAISKVSGCDQMWCTVCKTAFSWSSGRVEQGHIHNPHYWEYLSKRGEDLNEVNRMNGRRPRQLNANCIELNDLARDRNFIQNKNIREICRMTMHLYPMEIRQRYNPTLEERNKDLRLEYLKNKISDEKFKNMIYTRNKKFRYNDELVQILNAYDNMLKDTLISFYLRHLDDKNNVKTLCQEVANITLYIKESINKLDKRYKYSTCNRLDYFFTSILKHTVL